MTLQDAIKSGFPMSLPHWMFWVETWRSPSITFRKLDGDNVVVTLSQVESESIHWSILVCKKHHIVIKTAENANPYECLQCINPTTLPQYYPKVSILSVNLDSLDAENTRAFEMLNNAKDTTLEQRQTKDKALNHLTDICTCPTEDLMTQGCTCGHLKKGK